MGTLRRRRNTLVSGPAVGIAVAILFASTASPVSAGSHLWRINEVFSNDDGTLQFIELHECCGASGELFLRGLEVTSRATGSVFTFPRHLTGSTRNKYLLLATAGFSELPGAPEPDFILPDGFIGLDGDTLWYSEARNYDRFTFGPGDLPTDGRHSIQLKEFVSDTFTHGINSPTNYAGATGSVDSTSGGFVRGDCNDDEQKNITDAVFLLGALFLGPQPIACDDACDANDDGRINITDAVAMLVALFLGADPLPPPEQCAEDETDDPLDCGRFSGCA